MDEQEKAIKIVSQSHRNILRKAYKPKDLFLPPESLYPSEVSAWFTESSLMRAWMGQWLDMVLNGQR